MFLKQVIERNIDLVQCAIALHQAYQIRPDSFVVDVDQFVANAKQMLKVAKQQDIQLFFMLKQLGRNPYLAKCLVDLGYPGAVVVDFKEAEVLMEHQIPICNVGHLVQTPNYLMERLVAYGVDYFTVFSIEKMQVINAYAKAKGIVQKVMLRVIDEDDLIYSGQMEGVLLSELPELATQIRMLSNIEVCGLTVFPAVLFDQTKGRFCETNNFATMKKAQQLLKQYGIQITALNAPSATCSASLPLIKQHGGTIGEPGHGLTGTTPGHAMFDLVEKTAVVYVSEVSHNFKNHAYFYGGGFYRRGHWQYAYVVNQKGEGEWDEVVLPNPDSIDYYIGLQQQHSIGDSVVSAFRYQMFTSRSDVVLVKGIQSGKPEIINRYNPLGDLL